MPERFFWLTDQSQTKNLFYRGLRANLKAISQGSLEISENDTWRYKIWYYIIDIYFSYLLWTLATLLVYSSSSALSWLSIVIEKSGLFWLFFIGKVIIFLILVCSLTASFIANTLNMDCRTKPVFFIRKYYFNWQYKISAVFLILLEGNPKIWDTAFLE